MEKFSKVVKNARLGDGMITNSKTVASLTYISTDLSLLKHKEKLLEEEGVGITVKKTQESGYGGKKTIHVYTSESSPDFKKTADAEVEEIIKDLTKEDLYLWYLDDGSWHISRNTMHLYSNNLNEEQTELLIKKVDDIYGIKPRKRVDRKRDGREFLYLYFPRELVRIFRPEVKMYIKENNINSMMYKVGGEDYKEPPRNYLSNEEVLYIRSLYADGENDIKTIAERTGYEYSRVKNIVKGRTYKHVKEAN